MSPGVASKLKSSYVALVHFASAMSVVLGLGFLLLAAGVDLSLPFTNASRPFDDANLGLLMVISGSYAFLAARKEVHRARRQEQLAVHERSLAIRRRAEADRAEVL